MDVNGRIERLRALMREAGMDAYLVPTADFHESEYVGEHFKCRQFITGFTGSAGIAVITMDQARLWVDGRYFVQAAAEIAGSQVEMMKMGHPGVPTPEEYLEEALPEGGCLGFDGRVVNARSGKELEDRLEDKRVSIVCDQDLIGRIWEDRPALSARPAWVLDEKFCGRSALDKIAFLRGQMKKLHATVHLLTTLDDIGWLLNIRGDDIRFNPVPLAYVMVTMEKLYLFINPEILEHPADPISGGAADSEAASSGAADFGAASGAGKTVRQYLEGIGVTIRPYNSIYEMAGELSGEKVLLETGRINYALYRQVEGKNKIVDRMNPTALEKAVKNETEIANEKKAHIKDGVAMTKFIYWMKKNIGRIPMDELSVQAHLEGLRAEQEGYLEPSFATISAYGPHAAMCHYSSSPATNVPIEPKGLYLVDSGGHYYEGSTDITRTIAVGPLTAEEKEHFTLVLMSMLRLGHVRFLYGCRGLSIDYAAREVLWSRGLNFEHGTGHGVSYLGSVHERPNGIRFKTVPERQDDGILEAGMITSDEPGVYIEGSHGIRTENLLLCVKDEKNAYGQFLKFEFLTYVPIDREAIDKSLMTDRDIELLNTYHEQVYEKISPYLDEEEKAWLWEVTRAI